MIKYICAERAIRRYFYIASKRPPFNGRQFCEILYFYHNNYGIEERRTTTSWKNIQSSIESGENGGIENARFGGTSVIQAALYVSLKSLPACQCQTTHPSSSPSGKSEERRARYFSTVTSDRSSQILDRTVGSW